MTTYTEFTYKPIGYTQEVKDEISKLTYLQKKALYALGYNFRKANPVQLRKIRINSKVIYNNFKRQLKHKNIGRFKIMSQAIQLFYKPAES